MTTISEVSSVQDFRSVRPSIGRSLAGRGSIDQSRGRAGAGAFSNRQAEALQEDDEHFRDSIYNFNKLGCKDRVRCKFFDGAQPDEGPGFGALL